MPNIPHAVVQKTSVLLSGIIIMSFFTGKYSIVLANIGVYSLFTIAVLHKVLGRQTEVGRKEYKVLYLPLTGIFLIHLASGLNTEPRHYKEFWMDVVAQASFLLLPLAFMWLPVWSAKYLRSLYLLFFGCVILSAAGSTVYYLMHASDINKLYSQSQIMPTVPDYIRFSLMVVFAITIGVFFLNDSLVKGCSRIWLLLGSIFLILYLYLLAVRSGLGAFNVLGAITVGWLLIKQRRYKHAILLGVMLLTLPILSFYFFPTFRNKYYNTQYDVSQVQTTSSANNLSLVGRYYSYKVGIQLLSKHPWFGVGKADMEQEVGFFYKRDYPDIDPSAYLLPHNQFLYYLVAFGCVGLLAFILCFYCPLFVTWQEMPILLITHYIIISLSFTVEFTLDQKNQIGTLYSISFIVLGLSSVINKKAGIQSLKK